jgi:putative membrane protein
MYRLSLLAAVLLAALATPSVLLAGRATQPSAQDANYLQTSISGDRFEIIGGKLTLQKTQSAALRTLAHRLIRDHSRSLREAVAEARRDGIKIPSAPMPTQVWELNTLRMMSGVTFERLYSSLEVKDHQQDIEETTFEAQHGQDPDIRQSAKQELPILELHLRLSENALRAS